MTSEDRWALSGNSQGSGLGDVLTKIEGPSADLEIWLLPGNFALSTSLPSDPGSSSRLKEMVGGGVGGPRDRQPFVHEDLRRWLQTPVVVL